MQTMYFVTSEVLMIVNMKITIFWIVIPCCLVEVQNYSVTTQKTNLNRYFMLFRKHLDKHGPYLACCAYCSWLLFYLTLWRMAFLEFAKLLYVTSCSGAASVPGLPTAPRLQGSFSKLHNHIQPSAPNYKFWKT
jgi:hypothetical protein